jgi:Uma2 family endonuclease
MSIPANVLRDYPHRLFSVEEFHRLGELGFFGEDERIELIGGELVFMNPIGSDHAFTVDFLAQNLIKRLPDEYWLRVQNPIVLGNNDEPEPDIAIVKRGNYRKRHPQSEDVLWIIEVADSSLRYDREVKIPLYAEFGIPECWLIDLANRRLEVYRQPSASGYRLLWRPEPDERVAPEGVAGIELLVAELWA